MASESAKKSFISTKRESATKAENARNSLALLKDNKNLSYEKKGKMITSFRRDNKDNEEI
jgi:hypothetical protein